MKSPKHPDPRQDDMQISERRRKLLRAAAATAPVIATLRSGAAMANVSAYQCLINDDRRDDGLQQITESLSPQSGGWLQIQVPRRLYTGTYTCIVDSDPNEDGNDGKGCVPSTEPSTPKLDWDVLMHEGVFYEYDNTKYLNEMEVVDDPSTLKSSSTQWSLTWTHVEEDPVWAVAYYLRLDDYTDIIAGPDLLKHGVDDWQALTGSCWTSLGGLGDA